MLSIRPATIEDLSAIEVMVEDFVKGHPAEAHQRTAATLREAYFGAQFLHGGGGDEPSSLYERVAIGYAGRDCHLSGKAYQVFAGLEGLPLRELIRRLPGKELGLQPAEAVE